VSISEAIGGRDLRPSPRTVRRAVEVVLVVALAAQSARLLWAAVTPLDPVGEPAAAAPPRPFTPPPDLSALERFAPATGSAPLLAAEAVAAPPPPTITGYALHGVRASIFGDGGAAIIAGPDGKQASYRPGQTVGPGVKLTAIGRDAVTLSGTGGSVRLEIGAPPVQAAAAPAGPAPLPSPGLILPGGPPEGAAPAAQAMSQLGLSPRPQGGFTVGAQGGPALQQAGLQPGDVLLSVNGQPLDPNRADQLTSGLAGMREAEVQFQRNGQTLTTRIQTGAR
jgi:general secretion pathway protein C